MSDERNETFNAFEAHKTTTVLLLMIAAELCAARTGTGLEEARLQVLADWGATLRALDVLDVERKINRPEGDAPLT